MRLHKREIGEEEDEPLLSRETGKRGSAEEAKKIWSFCEAVRRAMAKRERQVSDSVSGSLQHVSEDGSEENGRRLSVGGKDRRSFGQVCVFGRGV